MKKLTLWLALCLSAFAIACGAAAPQPLEIEGMSDELRELLPDLTGKTLETTESGLGIVIIEEGSEDGAPLAGDTVIAHYTGYLADGSQFDSSRDRDQTFEFPLGQGRVIQGWDEGFAQLTPGTRALLVIPPELGYGVAGSGGTIPGNAQLFFDVELVDVRGLRRPIEVADADYSETANGLKYYTYEEGDGAVIADGDVALLDFAVWQVSTGELFGASADSGRPLGFLLGGAQMFDSMQEGVRGMAVGESRQLYMTAEQLTDSGLPEAEDIIFEITLLEIAEAGPRVPALLDESAFVDGENGVRYGDVEVGTGDVVADGTRVMVHYAAWIVATGEKFDSTYDRATPIETTIGFHNIPGWNEGILAGMTVGSTRQVLVPAELIGDVGLGQPESLVFEIEILEITQP